MAGLVAFGAISCNHDELVEYDATKAVAPVLHELTNAAAELVEGETFATFEYDAADYGVAVPIQYTLYVATSSDFSDITKVATVRNATSIEVASKDLNNILLGLGYSALDEVTMYFRVDSDMYGESSTIAGTTLSSNIISTAATTYDAEVLYDRVYLPGTANGWSHDVCQHLFNYSGDLDTYVGVTDFGEDHGENAFKVTGAAGWENTTGNWGVDDADTGAAEAASVQLYNGSNTNIWHYTTYRYYQFKFQKSSLLLTMIKGFNEVSVIGSFDGWAGDFVMTQDPYRQRFYVDIENVEAGTEFKFRFDQSWDYNLGGDVNALSNGGSNLVIEEAGNYRIYLDMNDADAMKAWWSTKDYGTEVTDPYGSGGGDEPDTPVTNEGWGIIGDFNEWGGDVSMTESDGVWTGYFTATAEGGFKLRKDGAWEENVGGTMTALGTAFEAVAGGDNITVAAGFWQVVYDTNAGTITVSEGNVYSLIGSFNSWAGDIYMTESESGIWVSPETTFEADAEVKIRYNAAWDTNYGGTMEAVGTAFTAVAGGDNIKIPAAGDYVITLNLNEGTILVETATAEVWSLIGVIEDSNWSADYNMKQLASGLWVSDPVTINGEFKIRYAADWGVNRGGTLASTGAAFAVEANGANISVPTTGAKYQVVYNPSLETITVNPVTGNWSVIGQYEGTSWDTDLFLSPKSDGTFESEIFQVDGDIKIRYEGSWDTNRGGTFGEIGTAFAVNQGGDNISNESLKGKYVKLVYDPSAETITLKGVWSLIGNVEEDTSWGVDYFMTETSTGVWEAGYTITGEFKLRYDCGWDINRGGPQADAYTCTLGEAFSTSNGSGNIKVPTEGSKYRIVYDSTAETITISAF